MQDWKWNSQNLKSLLLLCGGFLLVWGALYQIPLDSGVFGDFRRVFYPVGRVVDPYTIPGFFNPPWAVMLLRPFSALPLHAAASLWAATSLCVVLYSMYLLNFDMPTTLMIILNPFMWMLISSGNLDAFVILGYALNIPVLNVMLIGIKPQVMGLSILHKLDVTCVALVILSLLIWGVWPIRILSGIMHGSLYTSISVDIYPYGVPLGLLLLYKYRHNTNVLALTTYLFMPYVNIVSLIVYMVVVYDSVTSLRTKICLYVVIWAFFMYLYI